MYTVMDERGLYDMRCNRIIEAATCARNFDIGDKIGLFLEASDSGGVFHSLLLGQRAPSANHHQY